MLAIWLVILIAVVGLGSLAAVVFGLVYAIANKKPAVALGSVLVPVAVVFGLGLVGMMAFSARQGHFGGRGPVQVNWTSVPPVPGVPAAPAMPPLGLTGGMVDPPNPLAIDPDLIIWAGAIFLFVCGGLYFASCGLREKNCDQAKGTRRFGWGKAIILGVIAILLLKYTTFTVWHGSHQQSGWTPSHPQQVAKAQEQARRQLEEVQKMADAAADQAAAAQLEGKNFQEMLEQVTKPRIELGTDGAKLTIDAESKPTPTVAAEAGSTRVVVPISSETQESLARTAARLEQMADRVAVMADQLSDTGTLLGKAMVVLNERIDARTKSQAAAPTPTASSQAALAEAPEPASIRPALRAPKVAVQAVASAPQPQGEAASAIDLSDSGQRTIVMQIDRQLLAEAGLSYEQLKQALSDEGMWNGKVVRFDEQKLQITATGHFGDDDLARLKNTFLAAKSLGGESVHLSDLADVEAIGVVTDKQREPPARPAWVDEPPRKVGLNQREVLTAGEYATVQDCDRAMDVYLLLATYNRLKQLLGETTVDRRDQPELSFYYLDSNHGADDFVVSGDGQELIVNGQPVDKRLQTLQDAGITLEFIRREIAQEEYLETVSRSVGPMKRLYTRVEFRPSVDKELLRRWDELKRSKRFAVVGAGAGSVLALLGLAFGLLKVDTATKGYYTKRLFLGVPAAIIGGLTLLWTAVH